MRMFRIISKDLKKVFSSFPFENPRWSVEAQYRKWLGHIDQKTYDESPILVIHTFESPEDAEQERLDWLDHEWMVNNGNMEFKDSNAFKSFRDFVDSKRQKAEENYTILYTQDGPCSHLIGGTSLQYDTPMKVVFDMEGKIVGCK